MTHDAAIELLYQASRVAIDKIARRIASRGAGEQATAFWRGLAGHQPPTSATSVPSSADHQSSDEAIGPYISTGLRLLVDLVAAHACFQQTAANAVALYDDAVIDLAHLVEHHPVARAILEAVPVARVLEDARTGNLKAMLALACLAEHHHDARAALTELPLDRRLLNGLQNGETAAHRVLGALARSNPAAIDVMLNRAATEDGPLEELLTNAPHSSYIKEGLLAMPLGQLEERLWTNDAKALGLLTEMAPFHPAALAVLIVRAEISLDRMTLIYLTSAARHHVSVRAALENMRFNHLLVYVSLGDFALTLALIDLARLSPTARNALAELYLDDILESARAGRGLSIMQLLELADWHPKARTEVSTLPLHPSIITYAYLGQKDELWLLTRLAAIRPDVCKLLVELPFSEWAPDVLGGLARYRADARAELAERAKTVWGGSYERVSEIQFYLHLANEHRDARDALKTLLDYFLDRARDGDAVALGVLIAVATERGESDVLKCVPLDPFLSRARDGDEEALCQLARLAEFRPDVWDAVSDYARSDGFASFTKCCDAVSHVMDPPTEREYAGVGDVLVDALIAGTHASDLRYLEYLRDTFYYHHISHCSGNWFSPAAMVRLAEAYFPYLDGLSLIPFFLKRMEAAVAELFDV